MRNVVCWLVLLWAARGYAQEHSDLPIAVLTERVLRVQVLAEAPPGRQAYRHARQARYLIGAGAGLLAAGVFHGLFWSSRRVCNSAGHAHFYSPRITGPIVASVGAAVAAGSSIWLATTRRRADAPPRAPRNQRLGAALTALGVATRASVLLLPTLLADIDGDCND